MVEVDELAQRTVNFVKRYCLEPNGYDIEAFRQAYERIQRGVDSACPCCLDRAIDDFVEDSEEFVVIDIGSGLARGYTRELARNNPRARFYLVDFLAEDEIEEALDEESFMSPFAFRNRPTPRKPYLWVNDILHANGYGNMKYIERLLTYSSRGSQLRELKDTTRTRKVVVTGLRNPGRLALMTAREATYHRAALCFITPSAIESLKPREARTFLNGFTENLGDLRAFLDLVHEPEDEYTGEHKFDYHDDDERAKAIALKQIFALSLATRFPEEARSGVNLLINNSESYNQPDHLVFAQFPISRKG